MGPLDQDRVNEFLLTFSDGAILQTCTLPFSAMNVQTFLQSVGIFYLVLPFTPFNTFHLCIYSQYLVGTEQYNTGT